MDFFFGSLDSVRFVIQPLLVGQQDGFLSRELCIKASFQSFIFVEKLARPFLRLSRALGAMVNGRSQKKPINHLISSS